jgi:hypothetical protein
MQVGWEEGRNTNKVGKKVQYIKLVCWSANLLLCEQQQDFFNTKTMALPFTERNSAQHCSCTSPWCRRHRRTRRRSCECFSVMMKPSSAEVSKAPGKYTCLWQMVSHCSYYVIFTATFLDLLSQEKRRNIASLEIRVPKLETASYWLITHHTKKTYGETEV